MIVKESSPHIIKDFFIKGMSSNRLLTDGRVKITDHPEDKTGEDESGVGLLDNYL